MTNLLKQAKESVTDKKNNINLKVTKDRLEVVVAFIKGDIRGSQMIRVLPELQSNFGAINHSKVREFLRIAVRDGLLEMLIK